MNNQRDNQQQQQQQSQNNINRYDYAYGPSPRSQPTPSPTLPSNNGLNYPRFINSAGRSSPTAKQQYPTSSINLDAAAAFVDSAEGERAFSQLQRELGGGDGMVGLGFESHEPQIETVRASRERTTSNESANGNGNGATSSYDNSAASAGLMSPGGRIYAEPESLDGFGALISEQLGSSSNQNRPFGQRGKYGYGSTAHRQPSMPTSSSTDEEFDESNQPPSASSSIGNLAGGFGRPASMDIDMGGLANAESGEDNSFDFLLSPPGGEQSFGPAAGSSNRAAPYTGKSKGKDRTYPAPLLLKGDRPFGGVHPPSPILNPPSVVPLSIARKLSTSAGSSPAGSSNPSPSQNNPLTRSQWTNQHAVQPGAEASQPMPYQRHRAQVSSSSSFQHSQSMTSSLPYSHSSRPSTSSAATSSPSMSHGGFSTSSTSTSLSTVNTAPPPPASVASTRSTNSTVTGAEAPITPQALLLHILSMRSQGAEPMSVSQSHGPPSRAPTPMFTQPADPNHQRIRSVGSNAPSDATGDGDNTSPTRQMNPSARVAKLATVDLTQRKIAEVPIEVIAELKDEVEKLALGYNMLRQLPSFFNALHSLRYLNIRVNLISTFPPVLCEMPSLEILDISRNKIKVLPVAPGTLVNLKVFSISKNRIKRLPTWFAHMSRLQMLKIDHNPLEWPPRDITAYPSPAGLERPAPSKSEEDAEMNRWVLTLTKWIRDNAARENARDPISDRRRRPSYVSDIPSDDERGAAHQEQLMTRTESGRIAASPITPISAAFPRQVQHLTPPTAGLGIDNLRLDIAGHSRNNSHSTATAAPSEGRQSLKAKKSLPDLRQNHAEILAERMTNQPTEAADSARQQLVGPSTAAPGALRKLKDRPELFHSNSARAALPSHPTVPTVPARSQSVRPNTATNASTSSLNFSQPPPSGLNNMRAPSPGPVEQARVDFNPSPQPRNKAVDANGADRNSGAYFRRLSMLPTSTISKAVPANLLAFADAIRGILFSLSQIYSALSQFVVYASQDRLPAPIARLMGQANGSMSLLINALDRFDSLSRRGTPSPTIVRDIFTTCRENVLTFKQLIAALGTQLSTLIATSDVRYTRTLLLMLYGSMGEISNSWNAVTPLMNQLTDSDSVTTLILQPPTPSPRMDRNGSQMGVQLGRARSKTRRHAGSFSVEDVQLGAEIPPAPMPELATAGTSMGIAPGSIPASAAVDSGAFGSGGSYSSGANNAVTVKARPAGMKLSRGAPGAIAMPGAFNPRDAPLSEGLLTPTAQPDFMFGEPVGPWSNGGTNSAANSPVMSAVPHMMQESARGTPSRSSSFSRPPGMTIHDGHNGSLGNSVGAGFGARPVAANGHSAAGPFDQNALDAINVAINAAFDVYRMLLDSFDEDSAEDPEAASQLMHQLGPRHVKELTDLCIVGNESATKLRLALGRVMGLLVEKNGARFHAEHAKMMEIGNDFSHTVIRFAKLVKAMCAEHGFSPKIKDGLGNLTTVTRIASSHFNPPKQSLGSLQSQPIDMGRGAQPIGMTMMGGGSVTGGAFGQPGMMMVGGGGRI